MRLRAGRSDRRTVRIGLVLASGLALGGLLFLAPRLRGDFRLAITQLTNQQIQLTLQGESNRLNQVEVSTNLSGSNWVLFQTLFNTSGIVTLLDTVPTNASARYYRALQHAPTNGSGFNKTLNFNLTMESAANPSCGCGGEAYNQGVSLAGEGCADCGVSEKVGGLNQDTAFGNVMLHNGELTHSIVDLEIQSRGFNWKFTRRYRSGISFDGPLGRNWEFNYNRRLLVESDANVLRLDGNGRADRYVAISNGVYQSPRGFYTKLALQPGGGFIERDRYGAKVFYTAPDSAGLCRMTQTQDRRGNTMLFTYDASNRLARVTDTVGRAVDYAYDAAGRLIRVADFTGRQLGFEYDTKGDLISVTSPIVTNTPNGNDFPTGKVTRYAYSSGFSDERLNHNLLSITVPNETASNGPPRLRIEYRTNSASPQLDRILVLHLAGTNASGVPAGGFVTYAYQILGTAGSNDFLTAVFQTTVTDRNGNLTEYRFNQLGNIVRVREFSNREVRANDPEFFETRYEYNADGELTRAIHPEGNALEYAYDAINSDRFQQGNLLQITRLPDATRGGDQTNLVTMYTYDPLFNQVRAMTEPRGNDPAHVPPNGGANSAPRYTTTNTFDYQEAANPPAEAGAWGITIPPALLSLGDVNGDVRTNQAMGNLVRRQLPTVNLLPGSNQALAEGDTQQEIIWRYTYNSFGQLAQTEDPRGNLHTRVYFPENDPDGDGLDLIAGRDATTGGYLARTVRDAFLGPRRLDPPPAVGITNRFQRDRVGNPTRFTNGRGFTTIYTYNALDQIVQEEKAKVDASQAAGYLARYFYDANNNRVRVDAQNVTTDSASHLPTVVASHPYFQHRSAYDILDRLVEETLDATRDPTIPFSVQPESLTARYRYDANGNLVRHVSPMAVVGGEANNYESFLHDERDLLYSATRGGASIQASTWTSDYDRNGNRVHKTDAADNDATPGPETEITAYDGFDRRRSVVDRAGNEQRFAYDAAGNVVREEAYGPNGYGSLTNVLLRRTQYRHDEVGRNFQTDRALFIAAGVTQLVTTVLLDGPLTPGDGIVSERHEYDALGRLTYRIMDNNAVYRNVFDGAGRRITEILPLRDNVTPGGPYSTQAAFEYDASGNVVRRTDTHTNPDGLVAPVEETHHFVYDALDRLTRVTDALGQTHYQEYDSRGNVTASYDARGPLVADPLGLYTSGPINVRGNVTRYAYDGVNRRWREEREITTTGDGGAPRNLTNVFNADGLVVTVTEHDANSRIAARYDDLTNRTVYVYDPLNRPVAQTNADGGYRLRQYDRDDNATSLRDENNTLHTFVYDALGRRVSHVLAPDSSKTNSAGLPLLAGTTLQTFAYDGLSRLVRCFDNNEPADTNDDWVVEASYDSLNRLTEERQNGRAISSDYVSDERTAVHYPGTARVVHFGYDAHDQLIAVSNFNAIAINASLLGAACPPPVSLSFAASNLPPVLAVANQFNANRLLTQVQQVSTTAGFIGFETFTRNRENDVTAVGRQALNNPLTLAENLSVGLDSLGRETVFAASLNGPSGATNSTRRLALNGAQDTREVRDQFNQPVLQAAYSPTHEPEGGFLLHNASPGTGIRTRDANFVYQWDGLNRLRVVRQRTNPAIIVAIYNYDAWPAIYQGRRVQKTVANRGALDGTTRYYYDDRNTIEETRVLTNGTERVARQFLFGGGADEVLAMDADTNNDGNPDQLSFYLRDHNYNTTQLVDAGGQPVEFYFYDYGGQPRFFSATTGLPMTNSARGNPYLFTSQRFDAETGLQYFKARYYDPVYGVFLSRDPLGAWRDDANDGNGMALAGHNSWNWTDPAGLDIRDGKGCWKNTHKPKGKDHLATFEVDIYDPDCEEVNFIQIVRLNSYGWWGDWNVDDGTVGLLSTPAPAAPFYDDPVGCQPGHRPGDVTKPPPAHEISDEPSSFWCTEYQFETCAVCRLGKNAGKIYSCIRWELNSCNNETSRFKWEPSGDPSDNFKAVVEADKKKKEAEKKAAEKEAADRKVGKPRRPYGEGDRGQKP